ncbi:MAG: hypothetical protein CL917_11445 [Deltaproteobacteria bacterium]|nr:hypothetical protein [Deltaproteobacteria bacterium]
MRPSPLFHALHAVRKGVCGQTNLVPLVPPADGQIGPEEPSKLNLNDEGTAHAPLEVRSSRPHSEMSQ